MFFIIIAYIFLFLKKIVEFVINLMYYIKEIIFVRRITYGKGKR